MEKTNEKTKLKIVTDRSKAREIVREITNFGVNDNQILHIMFLLALNLEDSEKMTEISNLLKKYTESINTENKGSNIINAKTNKIILN